MLGARGAMGSQDPVLKDMQRLRSILGSETLKGRAGMPGAMSNEDRAFLQEMAANTGTLSVPRIQEVLSRNLNKINALEESMKNTYNIKYNTFGGFGGRTAEDGDFDSIMYAEE
jgi:hypothetical protein